MGLTSREIDKLMLRLDTNQDGKIDYNEFMAKFKTNDLDARLHERAKDKMARVKELMLLHMTSPNDAFRFVSIRQRFTVIVRRKQAGQADLPGV